MQTLCCLDVQGPAALEKVHAFIDDSREPPTTLSDAHRRLSDTLADLQQIDQLLARHARHWQLARLALVDRNILRLAVCELRAGQTPFKVVISEALDLAQEFSTAKSPRFINGILDAVAKEISSDSGDTGDKYRIKDAE